MNNYEIPSCSVCYERLASKLCALSKCGHVYHQDCLSKWIVKNPLAIRCPLCRVRLLKSEIVSLNYEVLPRAELEEWIREYDRLGAEQLKEVVVSLQVTSCYGSNHIRGTTRISGIG